MRLSVAMATFNGERFVAEQLRSIGEQTRPPHEILICDDGSTDGTLAAARAFASRSCSPVRIFESEARLGSTKNFERAVAFCEGDVIALADQDDVWKPHKLETLARALQSNPGAGAVFSDAQLTDESLHPLPRLLWDTVGFSRTQRARLATGHGTEVLLRRNVVTGATLAFRSALRGMLLPIPEAWVHDAWFALLISATAGLVAVADPLVLYRQHPAQQIGTRRASMLQRLSKIRAQGRQGPEMNSQAWLAAAQAYEGAYDRLAQWGGAKGDITLRLVQAKIRHLRARARLPEHRAARLKSVLRELVLLRYRRYSNGVRSAVADMLR